MKGGGMEGRTINDRREGATEAAYHLMPALKHFKLSPQTAIMSHLDAVLRTLDNLGPGNMICDIKSFHFIR